MTNVHTSSTESWRLGSAVLEECASINPFIDPRRRAQLFIKNVYPSKEKSWTTSIHRLALHEDCASI
jgi:hypothetical protein